MLDPAVVAQILVYAVPPLLGAVIGYVTNALAIRMLFRPLSEKRVLGIRIPFTPGILPRQRHRLSESIATMVSLRLLTPDVLLAKIHDPGFRASLGESVERMTADLLVKRQSDRGATDVIEPVLTAFLSSESFATTALRLLGDAVVGVLSLDASRFVPSDERLRSGVEHLVSAITSDHVYDSALERIVSSLRAHRASNTEVRRIIGRRVIVQCIRFVPLLYGPAFDLLISFLRQARTREELSVHGRDLLKQVLRRLNLLQRFIVSAAQYDRNLTDNMPAVVTDLIDGIERAGSAGHNRRRLVRSVQHRIADLGRRGIATVEAELRVDVADLVERAAEALRDMIRRPEVVEMLAAVARTTATSWRDRSVAGVAESVTGLSADEIASHVSTVAGRWLDDEDHRAQLADRAVGFVRSLLSRSTGAPGSVEQLVPLTPDGKRRIDTYVTDRIVEQLERRVPELIDSLDIHGMVVQKIDGLDMRSVEELLLLVIARHLKWINLFGALIGAIIGGSQVLLRAIS